jgi:hypothetical protein
MSNVSATVLIGLAAWTLFLVILMETLRARLIMTKASSSRTTPTYRRLCSGWPGRTPTASSVCPFSASY